MNDVRTRFSELFAHRVCINLDRRPERWQRMQARFTEVGLGLVNRISGVDGRNIQAPMGWPESAGAYGCLQSHLAVVRQARAQGWESILIMEDDVLFVPDFQRCFADRVRALPADWDMLFFGCLHHAEPTPVAPGIVRLHGSFSTFLYAVRQTVYEAFIELNARAECAVDKNNWQLQSRFNCYCFLPHLAWVDDSYSDAQGVATDHWYIRGSMVLGAPFLKSMEKRAAMIIPYRAGADRDRELKNLCFLANHYGAIFSAVLVVEQDAQAHVDRAGLPPHCAYCFVPGTGAFDRQSCWRAGLERCTGDLEYFIVNEGNVVCSRMEMRSNLSKCADYDAVSSFATYIDLDDADSDRVLNGLQCSTERYRPRARRKQFQDYFTARREVLQTLSLRPSIADGEDQAVQGLHVFESPGIALTLAGKIDTQRPEPR